MRVCLLVALLASGCIRDSLVPCGDQLCPTNLACSIDDRCVEPEQLAACAGAMDGDPCATSSIAQGTCHAQSCELSACGNGRIDVYVDDAGTRTPEACDDGNTLHGDGCSAECRSTEVCGNSIIDYESGEECDDGGFHNHDGCSARCGFERPVWTRFAELPLGRTQHGMVLDEARGRVVMFGGDGAVARLDDTWTWDGTSWTQQRIGRTPPARQTRSLAYDSHRHRVVMFGGLGLAGSRGDTWEWDGASWSLREPTVKPPPRNNHALVYDPIRRVTLLFGGIDGTTRLDDTWSWDGTAWTQLAPSVRPTRRTGHTMTFDPARGHVVLFGGIDGSGFERDDTWIWNGDWTELQPAQRPSPRSGFGLAFDRTRGHVVLFGGVKDNVGLNDTWIFDGTTWTDVTPADPAYSPPARFRHALVPDAQPGRLLLFGGNDAVTTSDELGDAWTWDGTRWRLVRARPTQPSARTRATGVLDARRGRIVMFSGILPGANSDETWEWTGTTWELVAKGLEPLERNNHASAYDSARGLTYVFGGISSSVILDDLWTWDGAAWTQVPRSEPWPIGRQSAGLVYDSVRGELVLFGGRRETATSVLDDTWTFDGTTWTRRLPATIPSPRSHHAMAFDPVRARTVMFGGSGLAKGETWEWDGIDWTQYMPDPSPRPRNSHSMAYDPSRRRVIVFGGSQSPVQYDDAWTWDGASWEKIDAIGPAARENAILVADPTSHRLLVFGGASGGAVMADPWFLHFESGAPDEACTAAVDADTQRDGAVGCADDECWRVCTPTCPPMVAPLACSGPTCGDGTCDPLENCRSCAVDCSCSPVCGDTYCDSGEACPGDCPP